MTHDTAAWHQRGTLSATVTVTASLDLGQQNVGTCQRFVGGVAVRALHVMVLDVGEDRFLLPPFGHAYGSDRPIIGFGALHDDMTGPALAGGEDI